MKVNSFNLEDNNIYMEVVLTEEEKNLVNKQHEKILKYIPSIIAYEGLNKITALYSTDNEKWIINTLTNMNDIKQFLLLLKHLADVNIKRADSRKRYQYNKF